MHHGSTKEEVRDYCDFEGPLLSPQETTTSTDVYERDPYVPGDPFLGADRGREVDREQNLPFS